MAATQPPPQVYYYNTKLNDPKNPDDKGKYYSGKMMSELKSGTDNIGAIIPGKISSGILTTEGNNVESFVNKIQQKIITDIFQLTNTPIDENTDLYRIVILYFRIIYCKEVITSSKDIEQRKIYSNLFIKNITALLKLLPSYLGLQQGGMDTAKMYNVQGLIQEMSAFNRGDSISPAMNFPSPFSGSIQGNTMGVMDSLPQAAVTALMPPLAGGKKKKVKRT